MASVKVVVTALRRYWAAGRCWEAGETVAEMDESLLPQLNAASGGATLEANGLDRSNPQQKSPCVLSYRIVEDPPPAPEPVPAPALEITDGPADQPPEGETPLAS